MWEERRETVLIQNYWGQLLVFEVDLNIPYFEFSFLYFLSICSSLIRKIIFAKENLRWESEAPWQREPWSPREKSSKYSEKNTEIKTSVWDKMDNAVVRIGVYVKQAG